MEIKDIVQRQSDYAGRINYNEDEVVFLISEYIKEKKGVYPPRFEIGNDFHQKMLADSAFQTALEYFSDKLNKTK